MKEEFIEATNYEEDDFEAIAPLGEDLPDNTFSNEETWYDLCAACDF